METRGCFSRYRRGFEIYIGRWDREYIDKVCRHVCSFGRRCIFSIRFRYPSYLSLVLSSPASVQPATNIVSSPEST